MRPPTWSSEETAGVGGQVTGVGVLFPNASGHTLSLDVAIQITPP